MGYRVAASLPSFAQGLHVFLVDDNSIFLTFLVSMLQYYSYKKENMRVGRSKLKRKYDEEEEWSERKRIRINTHINLETTRMKEEQEENCYDRIDRLKNRKGRIVWSTELHLRLIEVLSKLGDEKARLKAIPRMMNNPSLTLHRVANHLQKFKAQVQSINRKDESKIPSSKQPHGTSQVGPTSWSCVMGVELHQTSNFLHIPSPFATTNLQTKNENSENGRCSSDSHSCNANKSFGLQPEIYAEKQNYAWEEVDEFVKKGSPEDQILTWIEKADGMDGGDSLDCSLNQMQTLKQYADMLKVPEGNLEEHNCFGSEENCDVDRYVSG